MSLGLPQPHSYFSDHFSPVYLVMLPFYGLLPLPQTLLVAQTLALALGVVPIYLLARARFSGSAVRLAWVLAYFLFLPLAFINLYDFHELAFAVLPLGLALYFLETRRPGLFLLSLLAAFTVKEDLPLVGIGFAAYILTAKRDLRLGLSTLGLSLLTFVGVIRLLIPAFGGGSAYVYFASRYGQLGDSPIQIVETVLTNPRRLASTLFQLQKLKFVVAIFGPLLGASFLSGFGVLLLLPTLAILLLSNYAPQFSVSSHYAAPLIPLTLGTAIIGVARLQPGLQRLVTAAVLISSLGFSLALGDLPFSRHFDPRLFTNEPRYLAFASNLSRIPADASVAAENDLTPHLSHRRLIYDIEYEGIVNADYLALDAAGVGHDGARFDRQLADFESRGYQLIAAGDGLALLERDDRVH